MEDDPATIKVAPPVRYAPSPLERVRSFMKRHGRKLWWLHSAYALGLGVTVVTFARKGFDHARWLSLSLGAAWLLVVLFFRLFGSGRAQGHVDASGTKVKLRFFAMTYAMKNLYQGMLFFLLPFYWSSTTFWSWNSWFVLLLGICAILSTLDVVFDRVVFRFRPLAGVFHGVALFGCINLVVPALFPGAHALTSLLVATAIAVAGFWSLHTTVAMLRDKRWIAAFVANIIVGVAVVYTGRAALPPVPLYMSSGAVGTPLDNTKTGLAMSTRELHSSALEHLTAITDIVDTAGGRAAAGGDRLVHVWRHEGHVVQRVTESTARVAGPAGTVRLRSSLNVQKLGPVASLHGDWRVDVETQHGQLVGRVSFEVLE